MAAQRTAGIALKPLRRARPGVLGEESQRDLQLWRRDRVMREVVGYEVPQHRIANRFKTGEFWRLPKIAKRMDASSGVRVEALKDNCQGTGFGRWLSTSAAVGGDYSARRRY